MEHRFNIDLVNEELAHGARVAVEMSADSARSLVRAILVTLQVAEDWQRRPQSLGEVLANSEG